MRHILGAAGLVLAGAVSTAVPAWATSGSFQLGFGSVQDAQGGAGVATAQDAMSAAVNPALAVGVGRQFEAGIDFFSPMRGFSATGTGFVPSANVRSLGDLFLIPNMAYNHPLDGDSALNFAIYGNGGSNTNYGTIAAGCGSVYCGGPAGVDLMQAFISATYAQRFGNVSIGIAPTIAVQAFDAKGLSKFASASVDSANLTDRGYDFSYGGGLRAGVQVSLSDSFRFGVSGHTPMWMTKFGKYSGLFTNGGQFNIPASVTAGLAWDVQPDVTLMLDYQHIFYSTVPAISNSTVITGSTKLGSANGAGFGWSDVDVVKVGVEWRMTDRFTARMGYAYSTNPVGAADVTMGILAPGVTQHHVTAGGTYKVDLHNTIDFSAMYAFSGKSSGPEVTSGGTTAGSNITVEMHQFAASAGWRYTW